MLRIRRRRTWTLVGAVLTAITAAGVLTTASAAGAGHGRGHSHFPAQRNVYQWPFAWDSIWNLPLATTAKYERFDTRAHRVYIDWEDISVNPRFPTRTLYQTDNTRHILVHVDPTLAADGHWNNCASLLQSSPDESYVVQGQPMRLTPGGSPEWDYSWEPVELNGLGTVGCHGGSGLSGLGGDIRKGELPSKQPIRHALKISLNCELSCSQAGNGFQWPAYKADKTYKDQYLGTNPRVHMGTLFALPPHYDYSWITEPDVRKVAQALQTYGGYVVDRSGGPTTNSIDVQHGAESELPDVGGAQMLKLFRSLSIVTNSTQRTPGGGTLTARRLAPCAPPFTDGTGAAPRSCGRG